MSFRPNLSFTKHALPFILAALLAPGLANAFAPFVVHDIRVDGIQRVDVGTVFSYLPVKVGETFTEAEASAAIERLYSSGLFNDVTIDAQGNVLVVTVKERPTIAAVSFNGMHEFDAKAITSSLKQVGFGQGSVFDKSLLQRAEFEIKQQYLSKGKYAVEINPIITPLPRNRVGVSFDIFEGGVAKIRQISIVGNHAFSQGTLLDFPTADGPVAALLLPTKQAEFYFIFGPGKFGMQLKTVALEPLGQVNLPVLSVRFHGGIGNRITKGGQPAIISPVIQKLAADSMAGLRKKLAVTGSLGHRGGGRNQTGAQTKQQRGQN